MTRTIAVVAAGSMGAAIGGRAVVRGADAITSTQDRSPTTVARARAFGLTEATDAELASADLFLSIVPPDQASPLATRMAGPLAAAGRRATYVDLNAISPATALEVQRIVEAAGATFVDGGIIGGPPTDASVGPTLYLSGVGAGGVAEILVPLGFAVRVLAGGVGAASALKLSYAGLTKGTLALGAAMVLAATRAGVAGALRDELASSQPAVLKRLGGGLPGLLPKAYRWDPEMREIAAFIGTDRPEAAIYQAMADLFAALAADHRVDGPASATLAKFVSSPSL